MKDNALKLNNERSDAHMYNSEKDFDYVAKRLIRQAAYFYRELDIYAISELVDETTFEQCEDMIEIMSSATNELRKINDYRSLWNDGEYIGQEEFTEDVLDSISNMVETTMKLISAMEKFDKNNDCTIFKKEMDRCDFNILSDRIIEYSLLNNICFVGYYWM